MTAKLNPFITPIDPRQAMAMLSMKNMLKWVSFTFFDFLKKYM